MNTTEEKITKQMQKRHGSPRIITDPAGKDVTDKDSKEVTLDNDVKIMPLETKSIDPGANPLTVIIDVSLDNKGKRYLYDSGDCS